MLAPDTQGTAFRPSQSAGCKARLSEPGAEDAMSLALAQFIVALFEMYMLAGVVLAALFLPRAVTRLDPRVADAPVVLRLMILPGVVALWPLFAWRWLSGASAPVERNPHRSKAGAR
jgi:hypothetical protein